MRLESLKVERERRKWRQYQKAMEAKYQQEKDEIRTMEMMLDATWNESQRYFHRMVKGEAGGLPVHWHEYYDRYGNRIPDPKL